MVECVGDLFGEKTTAKEGLVTTSGRKNLGSNVKRIDVLTPRPAEYQSPTNRAEVLAMFDANLKTARANVAGRSDGEFDAPWTLKAGGKDVFTMPKGSVMRSFVLNHMVHHRGQMTVYLRLLGVKIPSLSGPSGDERM